MESIEELQKLTSNKNITVLGEKYHIKFIDTSDFEKDEDLKNCDGIHDGYTNLIKIRKFNEVKEMSKKMKLIKEVLRHEILHAFLFGSGLDVNSVKYQHGWAKNEEMIDWFAMKYPQIKEAYKKLGCE